MTDVLTTYATTADEDDGDPPSDPGATPVEVGEPIKIVQID